MPDILNPRAAFHGKVDPTVKLRDPKGSGVLDKVGRSHMCFIKINHTFQHWSVRGQKEARTHYDHILLVFLGKIRRNMGFSDNLTIDEFSDADRDVSGVAWLLGIGSNFVIEGQTNNEKRLIPVVAVSDLSLLHWGPKLVKAVAAAQRSTAPRGSVSAKKQNLAIMYDGPGIPFTPSSSRTVAAPSAVETPSTPCPKPIDPTTEQVMSPTMSPSPALTEAGSSSSSDIDELFGPSLQGTKSHHPVALLLTAESGEKRSAAQAFGQEEVDEVPGVKTRARGKARME